MKRLAIANKDKKGLPGRMKKQQKTAFFCQNCGYESPKWVGKCPGCGEWNRFAEEPTKATDSRVPPEYQLNEKPRPIDTVEADEKARLKTGMEEMDRVLGGGIVAGSAILVGATRGSASRPSCSRSCTAWPRGAQGPLRHG